MHEIMFLGEKHIALHELEIKGIISMLKESKKLIEDTLEELERFESD